MRTLKKTLVLFAFLLFCSSCAEENSIVGSEISGNQKSKQKNDLSFKFTPKPSNLPSKVPKEVICNYFALTGGWPLTLAHICGIWYGGYTPISLQDLNRILAENRTHTINHLYILSPSSQSGIIPFSSYTLPDNLSIRSEIVSFYQKVYVVELGFSITVTGNITQSEHIHKQAFIDSFFNWMFKMQISQPSTFNLLMSNNTTYRQLFNLFADYTLNEPASIGIYLGVPFSEYATNQKLRCLKVTSDHLLTNNGALMIHNLVSNNISFVQFRTQLNLLCN